MKDVNKSIRTVYKDIYKWDLLEIRIIPEINKIIKIPYIKSSIFAVIKIASLLNENSAINVPGMFL